MEIPFTKKYTLVSMLPQQEILSRVKDVVEMPQRKKVHINVMGLTNKTTNKPYKGMVNGNEFIAVRDIAYANSFAPVLNGSVKSEGQTSQIKMKISMDKKALLILAFVDLFMVFLFIMGFMGKLTKGNEDAVIGIPIVLGVLNTGIFMAYYYEVRKALKFFKLLLAGKEENKS